MAHIIITIDTDNAAFEDDNGGGQETARILHGLADKMEHFGSLCGGNKLMDYNGNTCGNVQVKE